MSKDEPKVSSWIQRLDVWAKANPHLFPKVQKENRDSEETKLATWLYSRQNLAKKGELTNFCKQKLLSMKWMDKEKMQDRLDSWEKGLRVNAVKPIIPLPPLSATPKALNVLELAQEFHMRSQELEEYAATIYQQARSHGVSTLDLHDADAALGLVSQALKDLQTSTGTASKRARCDPPDTRIAPREWLDVAFANLEKIHFPRQQRDNITVDGGKDKLNRPLGLSLGLNADRRGNVSVSAKTKSHAELLQFLCELLRHCKPDFTFSSVQIVKNFSSALHVDGNNLGPSWIIGLGDYTGGELWVQGEGQQNIKDTWYKFDGNVPHATYPIQSGTRYSAIFYTHKRYGEANIGDTDWLKNRKVHMPPPGLRMQEYDSKANRLKAAQAVLPAELATCLCVRNTEGQEDNGTVDHGDDAIDIDEEEEDGDLQMIEQGDTNQESDFEKALRISRNQTGLVGSAYLSDSQDQELQQALKLSTEEADERSNQEIGLIARLCDLVDVTAEVAQKALDDAGGDETIATLRLLEDDGVSGNSANVGVSSCNSGTYMLSNISTKADETQVIDID